MEGVTIRPIRAHETSEYRALRLRALTDAPTAFGEPLAEATARPMAEYEERVARHAQGEEAIILVAEADGGELVGLVGGRRHEDGTSAELVSMWVDPAWRGRGIAEDLVAGVLAWARERGCSSVSLGVASGNTAARRLYEGLGFRFTGDSRPLRSHPDVGCDQMDIRLTG